MPQSFAKSAVGARKQVAENPNSSLVAKTMKLMANSSHGHQIKDRSQDTETNYLIDKKTHAAINTKTFKKLNHVSNALYEVEFVKAPDEHKEPIIVGFFVLQYAKIRK